jgi:hypothetical protein
LEAAEWAAASTEEVSTAAAVSMAVAEDFMAAEAEATAAKL